MALGGCEPPGRECDVMSNDTINRLIPYAKEWRECLMLSDSIDGVVQRQETKDEIEVLDAFIRDFDGTEAD